MSVSQLMDEQQQDESNCPICAYQFSTPDKVPKILPCSHTFCSPCIDNIIAATPSNSDSAVKCPICRQDIFISKDGVQGFFDNYFKSAPKQEEMCDICGAREVRKLKHCHECNSILCSVCHKSHHHKDEKKFGDFDEDSDEENDGHRDLRILRRIGNAYRSTVKSAFFAYLSTSFKCNNFERIRKIIPDDKNECWVLTNRPFVATFSRNGQEMYRKYVENVLQDIARFSDGTLVLAFSSGDILLLRGQELSLATTTENSVPISLYAYDDGRLLIATRPHSSNTHLNNSGLYITDLIKKKIRPLYVNNLCEESSMTVNEKTGQVALCETTKKRVYFVSTDKKFKYPKVKKYTGKRGLQRLEQSEDSINITNSYPFQPQSIASDQNDNFYILDAGTNLIHVVDEEATFQSIVLATMFGSISCFNVDSHENLWIGDISGQIRVFRMERYNFLGPEETDTRSEEETDIDLPIGGGGPVSIENLGRIRLLRVGRSNSGGLELPEGFDLGSELREMLSGSSSNREEPTRIRDNFIRNTF